MNSVKLSIILVIAMLCFCCMDLQAQQSVLTLEQQQKDFEIFKGGWKKATPVCTILLIKKHSPRNAIVFKKPLSPMQLLKSIDMPFLCFGDLKKNYPAKLLPDYKVTNTISDVMRANDSVLVFVLKQIKK